MGIVVSRIAARPPSVKCRICGRMAAGSGKLCDECASAVKRARHVSTVSSQFLPVTATGPSISLAQTTRVASRNHRARTGIATLLPEKPGGWVVLGAFLIFGATVCLTGFYAVQEIEEAGSRRGSVSVGLATPPMGESRGAASIMPRDSQEAPPAPNVADGDEPAQAETVATPAPMPASPKVSYRRSADGRLRKTASAPNELPARPSDTDQALRPSEEAASAPAIVASPAVVAEQPVVPDRWQAMNTALDQCSRESFLAGVVCGERARLQYCDGYWGKVPQCRGANRPENSR
jgi:hypothetical protein